MRFRFGLFSPVVLVMLVLPTLAPVADTPAAAAIEPRAELGAGTRLISSRPIAGERFGYSVAVDRNTMVVGEPGNQFLPKNSGRVHVFRKGVSGWRLIQTIRGPGNVGSEFGFSVALEDDTLVVGAPYATADSTRYAGLAYVYTLDGARYRLSRTLVPSNIAPDTNFGWDVAVSGDTIAVSAPFGGLFAPGQVSIFEFVRGAWRFRYNLSLGTDGDAFGYAVAIDGDRMVVGARGASVGARSEAGRAYVFERPLKRFRRTASLRAGDPRAGDMFGYSVDVEGDWIVVGAPAKDRGQLSGAGAYYSFRESGGWLQTARVFSPRSRELDWFGESLDLSGSKLAVGSSYTDVPGASNVGTVFLMQRRSDGTWYLLQQVWPGNRAAQEYAYFGESVAYDRYHLAAGAKGADVGARESAGAAWVFPGA